jgi:hypothetical protein
MAPLALALAAALLASPADAGLTDEAVGQAMHRMLCADSSPGEHRGDCRAYVTAVRRLPRTRRWIVEYVSGSGCWHDPNEPGPRTCPSASLVGPDLTVTASILLRDSGGDGGAFGERSAQWADDHYEVCETSSYVGLGGLLSGESSETRYRLTPTKEGLFGESERSKSSTVAIKGHFRDEQSKEELDLEGSAARDGDAAAYKTTSLRVVYSSPKQKAPVTLIVVSADWSELQFVVRFPKGRAKYRLSGAGEDLTSEGDDGTPAQTFKRAR